MDNYNFRQEVLAHWQAPEHEVYQKDRRWFLYAGLILMAIVGYAIWTDSPMMAITFILIGALGYIFANTQPRIVDFYITESGIIAGRELYEFQNIKSFWIFYEPHQLKVISLHMKGTLMPFIHIPIHDEDPVEIRELLMQHIEEVRQEPSVVDTLERILRI